MTAILAVVGPTASGKTALALDLAERLRTEIISADSMQIYRGMAIGTAAPTEAELARVRHHFVGCVEPGTVYSAGDFQREARRVAAQLNAAGKIAVVAGGSGLYIDALIDGLFEGPGRDETFRARFRLEAEEVGLPVLYARLQRVDPEYASRIHPGDYRRIERALEVFTLTGHPASRLHREHRAHAAPLPALRVAVDLPRPQLYARIDRRVERMMASGFLDEVQHLLDMGHETHITRMRSLGYREMIAHLRGELPLEEAVALMQRNTRRFAKRQLTWFRHTPGIHWFPITEGTSRAGLADRVMALLETGDHDETPPPP